MNAASERPRSGGVTYTTRLRLLGSAPMASQPDPSGGRPARQADDFNASYAGKPPWDIGRPQPAFLALADAGALQGRVLDAGCGTGEHALMASARGFDATGIDFAPAAIEIAEQKARDRGLEVRFLVFDALELGRFGERFDTVLDCGLFHVFADDDRARYVAGLGAATVAGARYHLLCFSDQRAGRLGAAPRHPRRDRIELRERLGDRVDRADGIPDQPRGGRGAGLVCSGPPRLTASSVMAGAARLGSPPARSHRRPGRARAADGPDPCRSASAPGRPFHHGDRNQEPVAQRQVAGGRQYVPSSGHGASPHEGL